MIFVPFRQFERNKLYCNSNKHLLDNKSNELN